MTTGSEVRFGLWELRRPVFDDILADQCRSAGTLHGFISELMRPRLGLGSLCEKLSDQIPRLQIIVFQIIDGSA